MKNIVRLILGNMLMAAIMYVGSWGEATYPWYFMQAYLYNLLMVPYLIHLEIRDGKFKRLV